MKSLSPVMKGILIGLIIIVTAVVVYMSLPWTLIMGSYIIDAIKYDPEKGPKPEVTCAEFSVELTYEYNDEIFTVSDVYVCEFESYEEHTGYISWKSYMKSTGEKAFVLHEGDNEKVYCRIGSPSYFMGQYDSGAINVLTWVDNKTFFGHKENAIEEEALYEQYKITLIGWTASEPIENSFEEFPFVLNFQIPQKRFYSLTKIG